MTRPDPIEIRDHHLTVVRGPREDGRWYWRARNAARETVWTGWGTPAEARAALRQLLRESEPPPKLSTLADLIHLWRAAREDDPTLRDATRIAAIRDSRHALRLLGDVALERVDQTLQEHYRNTRLGEGAAPRTVLNELVTLRCAWRWAIRAELLQAPPLPTTKVKIRGAVLNRRTPSVGEVTEVLRHMTGEELLAGKVLAITGARVSEVTGLRRCDVDLQEGFINLCGKTGPRSYPLTPALRALLQERASPSQEPLIGLQRGSPAAQVWRALQHACRAAGVQPFSPHGLRRMAVNRLLRAGVDLKVAAAMTGHSVRVMLTVYRKATEEDREIGVRQAGLGRCLTGSEDGGQPVSGSQKGAQRLKGDVHP